MIPRWWESVNNRQSRCNPACHNQLHCTIRLHTFSFPSCMYTDLVSPPRCADLHESPASSVRGSPFKLGYFRSQNPILGSLYFSSVNTSLFFTLEFLSVLCTHLPRRRSIVTSNGIDFHTTVARHCMNWSRRNSPYANPVSICVCRNTPISPPISL